MSFRSVAIAVLMVWTIGCKVPVNLGDPGDPGASGSDSGSGFIFDSGFKLDAGCFIPAEGNFDGGASSQPPSLPLYVPSRPPPPISGGTLAAMSDGTMVAADSDRDLVWIVTPSDAIRQVALTVGDEPGRVIEGPAGRAFVALRGGTEVAEIEVAAAKLVARHAACPAPRGMGWSPSNNVLTVACASGALARLSFDLAASGPVFKSRVLQFPADDLRDVVQRPHDVLVSTFRDARILAVADDGSVTPVLQHPSFTPGTRQVAWRMVGRGTGALMTFQEEAIFPLTESCQAYGGPNGGVVGLALAYVDESLVESRWTGQPEVPLAVDLAVSTSGLWSLVSAGTNLVVQQHSIGGGEFHHDLGGEPVAVAYRGEELVVFSREPSQLSFAIEGQVPRTVTLPGVSVKSTAHALFHRVTQAGLACASCHPEGRDDGHLWTLPEGKRRTNTLRGGLKASAPFHWQGDRADMGALLEDVLVHRMGGTRPSMDASSSLMDWLDAMPAIPGPGNLDAAAVLRGKALFESTEQGCATCHAGALGTNNTNNDVGTGGSFQVPRLVGLASHPPYFHDGSIAKLEDRFSPAAGGELHGHPALLTAGQKADLIEYLKSR
jgi:hypothetical protein